MRKRGVIVEKLEKRVHPVRFVWTLLLLIGVRRWIQRLLTAGLAADLTYGSLVGRVSCFRVAEVVLIVSDLLLLVPPLHNLPLSCVRVLGALASGTGSRRRTHLVGEVSPPGLGSVGVCLGWRGRRWRRRRFASVGKLWLCRLIEVAKPGPQSHRVGGCVAVHVSTFG